MPRYAAIRALVRTSARNPRWRFHFANPATAIDIAVPALLGCTSQGETREEALSMIREAIELYIESLVSRGDPIPGPVEIERVTVAA